MKIADRMYSANEFQDVIEECDRLRAENERLRAAYVEACRYWDASQAETEACLGKYRRTHSERVVRAVLAAERKT